MFEMMPLTRAMMSPFYDIDKMTRSFFGESPVRAFRTDIQDNGDSYTLEAELPGFQKEDIAIDIDGDQLTIQAHHNSESEQKDDAGNYLRRERFYGSYSRSFDISQINADEIHAAYENGILKLELPKKTAAVPASRRLEIQ
ncbi:MAG: Hsp20/alpha crystallin family protein [Oscillospiraceae bacterium]|nr:Hsp20/alpha crystallin family protein [Oscillospiraceae bacterium]